MATLTSNLPFSNLTLTDFKAWAQGIGTALSTFGWSLDANVLGAVNWSTIVNRPGDVPGVLPNQAQTVFRGAYSTASVAYNANDIVTYNGASWINISAYTSSVSTAYPGNDYGGGTQHWQLYPYEVWQSAVTPTLFIKFEYHGNNASNQYLPQVRVTVGTSDSDVFTLTSVATHSGATTVYTGTITGGGGNNFSGQTFVIAGFTNGVNNGTFTCSASTTTTLTLSNGAGTAETHAATATSYSGNLGNGTGQQQTTAQFLMPSSIGATSVSTADGNNNFPSYFSGDNGNRFAMLMWDPYTNANVAGTGAFFFVERSLTNAGAYYTTPSGSVTPYWVVGWAGYSTSQNMQALLNTTGTTWVKTAFDNAWWVVTTHGNHNQQIEQGSSSASSWMSSIGSQSMPFFPVIPLVGMAGNPLTAAGAVKQADGPWGTLTVQMYGSTRTYYVSHNTNLTVGGGTGNWLCMRFD